MLLGIFLAGVGQLLLKQGKKSPRQIKRQKAKLGFN
jgi:hypothetical protein